MTTTEQQSWEHILDARLVTLYDIDVPTLKTNRQGRMTPQQRQRLQRRRWRKIGNHTTRGVIALGLLAILIAVPAENLFAIVLAIVRFIVGVAAITQLWFAWRYFRRTSREIAAGNIKMYPGRLHHVEWYGIRILFCERGEFYNVPRHEWEAFDHHARYRIFCTPHTKIILAAQPVHQDEPLPEAWSRYDDQ